MTEDDHIDSQSLLRMFHRLIMGETHIIKTIGTKWHQSIVLASLPEERFVTTML
ncbi:hypothetical protein AWENTII_003718 [Aspergillus wentii]